MCGYPINWGLPLKYVIPFKFMWSRWSNWGTFLVSMAFIVMCFQVRISCIQNFICIKRGGGTNSCFSVLPRHFQHGGGNCVLLCCTVGWICYAEKTHGSFILPFISSTKSPQQIMGSLVKDYLAKQLGKQ